MKLRLLTLTTSILLQFGICCGQNVYYKLSNDSLINENSIKPYIDYLNKNLLEGFVGTPIVFHKVEISDSIINYFMIRAERGSGNDDYDPYKIVFIQDSLYLLLDEALPDFQLRDSNDKIFSSEKLKGKPTLINFWTTANGYEIPQLNLLKEKYGDSVNFIAITERACNENVISDFLKIQPFDFYLLFEGDAYKEKLKISSLPVNIFLDKDGYIRHIHGGLSVEYDSKTGRVVAKSNKEFVKIIEDLIK